MIPAKPIAGNSTAILPTVACARQTARGIVKVIAMAPVRETASLVIAWDRANAGLDSEQQRLLPHATAPTRVAAAPVPEYDKQELVVKYRYITRQGFDHLPGDHPS